MAMAVGCSNETTTTQNNTSTNENTEVASQNDTSANENAKVAEIKTMTGEELVKQNSGKEKDKVLIIDVVHQKNIKQDTFQMLSILISMNLNKD